MTEAGVVTLNRTAEMAAMFMIGDGVLGLLMPERHVALWRSDIATIDALTKPFREHARRRRIYGLLQVGAGLALATAVTRRR